MRIIDAKVIVCSPGRNFVTLKVTTEDGIYGLGDATLNGRELAVASYLYDHANGPGLEETVQAVADYIKLGYKAIRAQSGIPGLQSTYGVGRGKLYYEPAEKNAPLEDAWSSELYLNFVPRLFERLRKEFGEDLPLLHDVHHRLTPIEAARLGKSLEPFHLFWLEDPVPAELQESL